MTSKSHRTREICALAPIVPVLVVDDAAQARPLAEALVAGGLPAGSSLAGSSLAGSPFAGSPFAGSAMP